MECSCFSSSPTLQRPYTLCRVPSTSLCQLSHCALSASFSLPGTPISRLHPPLCLRASPSVKIFASIPAQPTVSNSEASKVVPPGSVSVILLAGGTGKRMGANMPKQYLPLLGQPIALHSLHTFASMEEVNEIVVVCDPSYRDIFEDARKTKSTVELKFALPGRERQFSVYNGLQEICGSAKLACVHDSARPLVLIKDIQKVILDAYIHGAAVLGVPVKGTIKEAKKDGFVSRTLDRSSLWEMQTPQVLFFWAFAISCVASSAYVNIKRTCMLKQVIEPSLLRKGFQLVEQQNLEVTDDVSIVEHLKHPVFITEGSYTNIKVTTPDDMIVAERILQQGVKVQLEHTVASVL